MSDTGKRRWFQFHLLTAILLVLATGLDLKFWVDSTELVEYRSSEGDMQYSNDFGFPLSIYRHSKFRWTDTLTIVVVLMNLPLNVCPIFGLTMVCEFILRRREELKHASS